MPRKSPDQLKSGGGAPAPAPKVEVKYEEIEETTSPAPAPAPRSPAPAPQPTSQYHPADLNGDGVIDAEERQMELEFRRKALEDQDAMRDAQRRMAWFALGGMLLYPFAVVLAVFLALDQAADVLGSMAATYFVSVAAIVAAFFGGQAYTQSSSAKKR